MLLPVFSIAMDQLAARSIILFVDLKVSLRMVADGTYLGRLGPDDNVTAVAALPDLDATLFEDLLSLHNRFF